MEIVNIPALITEIKLAGDKTIFAAACPTQTDGQFLMTITGVIDRNIGTQIKLQEQINVQIQFPTAGVQSEDQQNVQS